MHRATPSNAAFRAYTAGGARSVVGIADDMKLMQEMAGRFMANEARKAIESPQNFGFTSVVMDAIQSGIGKIVGSAETFISFMGGNRSFPVAGNMDDRRHRLNGLMKGDTSMFGTVGRMLQFHMASDGMFGTAPQDKTIRMALLSENSQQDATSQSFQAELAAAEAEDAAGIRREDFVHVDRDGVEHRFRHVFPRDITNYTHIIPIPGLLDSGGGSGGSSGSGASGAGMKMGQKSLKDKNQKSKRYIHLNKDEAALSGTNVRGYRDDGNCYFDINKDGNVYLGGKGGSTARSSGMLRVMLEGEELSKNVYALGGGGSAPDVTARNSRLAALEARVEQLESRIATLEAAAR